ncbi:ATP-binding protein [Streptomyces sp. NPDC002795]|uniref:ATP-binding protein n=1 Tax=Streptomyces sp. NPDC002795 TaxID=3364665 RepID=UPI003698C5CF
MHTQQTHTDTGTDERTALRKRPEAAADARLMARRFLNRQRPAVPEQDAASVELVVSELVTNTVRHARGSRCSLRLQARPDSIVVTVADADRRPPRERAPDVMNATGGFGWPMIRHLARSVAVTTDPGGKTIRATLPRGGEGGPLHPTGPHMGPVGEIRRVRGNRRGNRKGAAFGEAAPASPHTS